MFSPGIEIVAQGGLRAFHGLADIIAALDDFDNQRLSGFADRIGDFARLAVERLGHIDCGLINPAIDAFIGLDKGFDQLMAAQADLLDHLFAAVGQSGGNIFGALAQQHRHAGSRIADGGRQAVGGCVQFGGQALVGTRNALFQAVSLIDNGFALRRQIVDQRAQAHLVLVIGGFNRRDFGVDDGFKLGGARHGAFDPVAHRRHFAADGLRQIEHGVGCHAFWLDQPHRDLGHRLRDILHFMGAARQIGNAVQGCDRQSQTNGRHHAFGTLHHRQQFGQAPAELFTGPIAGSAQPCHGAKRGPEKRTA